MKEYDEALQTIRSMDDIVKLKEMKSAIVSRIENVAFRIGRQLYAGDRVKVTSKRDIDYGHVVKVNRTRAVVNLEDKGNYNVPFSMITLENGE
mgnify:CR=1 FL=1